MYYTTAASRRMQVKFESRPLRKAKECSLAQRAGLFLVSDRREQRSRKGWDRKQPEMTESSGCIPLL